MGWLSTAIVVIAIVAPARSAHPQSLEPRSYVNTPVGINFLLAGYGYTQANVAFEASSPIKDAKVHVNSGVLGYARSLDLWGLSGKFAWAVSVSRNQSIKFYTSNGVYSRSTDNFWVTGIGWQFRRRGGL